MKKLVASTLLLIAFIFMSGCDIPLITQFQLKRYFSKTENNYFDTKNRFDDIKGYIFNSHGEDQEIVEIKKTIDDNFEVISNNSSQFNKTKSYSFTNNLSSGLNQYYEKVIDFSEDIKLMYSYFDLSEKTANDLISTANKIPRNPSGNNTKLIKELTKSKQDYQTKKDEISKQTVPDYFYQAKVSLTTVLEAYIDYLTSVIKGLKTKDSQYFDVDQFVMQMDNGVSRFSDQLIVIEKRGQFELRSQDIEDLQKEIEEEITNLKTKYKIK